MERKEELKKQIEDLESQLKPLQKELTNIYIKEGENVEEKIKRCESLKDKFELSELRFSSHGRCECGAGLAYPKKTSIHGSWYCSDILLGRALPKGVDGFKQHSAPMPFAFYEIKSEDQPSANGLTTRPTE